MSAGPQPVIPLEEDEYIRAYMPNYEVNQYNIFAIGGSVRSGSGLSPEGCNFSRFLESGYQ